MIDSTLVADLNPFIIPGYSMAHETMGCQSTKINGRTCAQASAYSWSDTS
ncbi:MAG: hypothetical protein ACNYWM_11385 [Methanosarcinales archaeon]